MLICPICSAALGALDNGVGCPAGHRFDRARQGYLNLLPVQHKNSRDPGDNLAMVEARRDFLNAGHYAPVAKRLAELAASYAPARWVDIGCGEGYYTAQIADALFGQEGPTEDVGVDRQGERQLGRDHRAGETAVHHAGVPKAA